jgi:chromosome segregation ATPase
MQAVIKRKRNKMDDFKETTLKGHVQLCELRYKALEERLDAVENKLQKLEEDLSELKTQTQSGFSEIKILLERNHSARQVQMIATFGTIVTAILGFIGYLIAK